MAWQRAGRAAAGLLAAAAWCVGPGAPAAGAAVQPRAAEPDRAAPGITRYLSGLEVLETGDAPGAVAPLTAALEAEPENADYYLARGVALALCERLPEALADLQRADRLRPNHRLTRCWLASVTAMQGNFMDTGRIHPYAGRDAYENAVRAMSHQYGDLNFRRQQGDPLGVQQAQPAHDAARAQFGALARGFVERVKPAGGPVSGVLKERGIARYKAGDFAGAFGDLLAAHRADAGDMDVLYHLAGCKLSLGAPEGARADYTAVLVERPEFAYALLGRSSALARLGDGPNARADLAGALALRPDIPATYAEELENRLRGASASTPEARAAMLGQIFEALSATNAQPAEVTRRAEALVRAGEFGRLRGDERYEKALRGLRSAASRPRATADDHVALAEFLYREAQLVLGEAVEPRAPRRTFRPQTDATRERELAQAEAVADRALSMSPDHARGLAIKAGCRFARDQDWVTAERLLTRAVERDPKDPVILELLMRVLDYAAHVQMTAAAGLRSTTYAGEDEYYIYYRRPTQAELDRAAELEALAHRLWERARRAIEDAAAARPGTATAFYYSGVLAERNRDLPRALAAYRRAVEIDPAFLDAWQRLDVTAARLGQAEESARAQTRAVNLAHTSAAPLLKLARLEIERTASQSAMRLLDEAALIDPADPRVAAYRGCAARAAGQHREAYHWFVVGSILEEMRLRSLGLTPLASEGPELRGEEVARLMALYDAASGAAERLGSADLALSFANLGLRVARRVPTDERYVFVPAALLPEVPVEAGRLPDAVNVETLACWCAVRAGRAHAAAGRFDEALPLLEWAASFESRKPPTMDQGMAVRAAGAWAMLAMADLELRRGDARAAGIRMRMFGHPSVQTPEMQAEADRLRSAIEAAGFKPGGDTYHDMLDRQRRGGGGR